LPAAVHRSIRKAADLVLRWSWRRSDTDRTYSSNVTKAPSLGSPSDYALNAAAKRLGAAVLS